MKQLAQAVNELPALKADAKYGDCIQIDRYPEDVRRYIKQPFGVRIRQTGITTWRVWLVNYNA